ncbi:hypothetical protein MFLAVUS_011372 [Mucor flavus]|uniref:Uncharacterized protein n=1 Tax=Mucor flavus TaxID=439312 RepID=A0ABP9ZFE1_9FUNG
MATTYNNNIVECFEARLKAYILYNITKTFEKSDSAILRKIVHEYCYRRICGGSPAWPEDVPEIYNEKKQEIDEICQELITIDIPRPVTLQSLAASPGSYIPTLATILQKNEQEHARITSNELDETPPRLFSLVPAPSLKWRFIDINANVLAAFTRKKLPDTYATKLEMFQQVFDFKKLKIYRFKVAFSNFIRSNGFTVDVALMKSNEVEKNIYYAQDVNVSDLAKVLTTNDLSDAKIRSIDPNSGQVFTASYGKGENQHQIRRFSTKEYYTLTGSKRHVKQETKRMCEEDIQDILLGVPTAKTASLSRYLLYVTYIMLHLNRMLAFNSFCTTEERFHLYQGVQRAREEMVNILLNGGKKI